MHRVDMQSIEARGYKPVHDYWFRNHKIANRIHTALKKIIHRTKWALVQTPEQFNIRKISL